MKTPFRLEYDETIDPDACGGSFIIYDNDNNVIINGGTYSHDGDEEVNLNWREAKELVALINKGASNV